MKKFNVMMIAALVAGSVQLAQAADGPFAGLTYGHTSDKLSGSRALNDNFDRPHINGILHRESTWGLRAGYQNASGRVYATYDNASASHHGLKLRQEHLLASADVFVPVADATRFFGGASLGTTKLAQESRGYSRDTDYGYTYGVQAGILQQLSPNVSMELGYRYLRTHAGVKVADRNDGKLGSLKVDASAQAYAALNYSF